MADIALVKQKVQNILAEGGGITIDSDGDFSDAFGSARVFCRVREIGEDKGTIVETWAPLLREVQPTPEMYEYLMKRSDDWLFGHPTVFDKDDGTVSIFLVHRVLGDFLDRDELMWAFYGLGSAADKLDDELKAKFGGKLFGEE